MSSAEPPEHQHGGVYESDPWTLPLSLAELRDEVRIFGLLLSASPLIAFIGGAISLLLEAGWWVRPLIVLLFFMPVTWIGRRLLQMPALLDRAMPQWPHSLRRFAICAVIFIAVGQMLLILYWTELA